MRWISQQWRAGSSPVLGTNIIKENSPYIVRVDKNITLRIRTKCEAVILFGLIKENKKHLSKFLNWVNKTKDVTYIKDFISKKLKEFKNGEGCDMGIYFDGIMIGSGGYHKIDKRNNKAEIGYWISKEYEGRGIVTKVIKKILEIGKKKYKLHRIEIRMDVENKKSQAIPKRLGFHYDGTIKESVIINGEYRDMEIWSLINKKASR